MERSLLLAMGLTGNWGKPGTGFNCFLIPETGFQALSAMDAPVERWGCGGWWLPAIAKSLWMKLKDPAISDELVSIAFQKEAARDFGSVMPVFYMYNHAGYDELWDRPEWQDPSLDRTFGQYLKESVERGYWDEAADRAGAGPAAPGADADGAQPPASRAQRPADLRGEALPQAEDARRRGDPALLLRHVLRHRAAGGLVLREGRPDA